MNTSVRAKATAWELGSTHNGGVQVGVSFVVTSGDRAGEGLVWYGSFSDTVMKDGRTVAQMTIESLRTMGWTGDDLSRLDGVDRNEVVLVLGDEEYEGRMRERVKFVNAIGGNIRLAGSMSDNDKRAFAARMKGLVIQTRKPGSAAPQGKPLPQDRPDDKGDAYEPEF